MGLIDHAVEKRYGIGLVAENGILNLGIVDLVNVVNPGLVALYRVDRERRNNSIALGPLILELCNGAKLGGADRSEVTRVAEDKRPLALDVLVPLDIAKGGGSSEIRS